MNLDVVWRTGRWSVVLAACAAIPAGAELIPQAQVDLPAAPGTVNPENFNGKESTEGVYVPESELAMERLALAQKMERLKEWNKSADLYQEILTDPKYTSKVVPSRQDADEKIYQYTSVEELVMQRLARWPDEGLQVYRARYEAQASALLESARPDDLYTLHQVFSRYFVTDSGKQAGMRLIDHYLEGGEFRAAASIADKLVQCHPNVVAEKPGLLYRAAIACHLGGDDAGAKLRLEQLRKSGPQDKGVVRGQEVLLADSLARELTQPVPVPVGTTAESYVTFGGDFTRDRVLAGSSAPGARLYSVELSKPSWAGSPQRQALEARHKEDVKNGLTIGIMPVIDRGDLFFQDGQRVYAVSLESGVPLPGWQQSHGADHGGAYALPSVSGSPRDHQLTLTVTDRAVLAVMGQQDNNVLRVGGAVQLGETRLVCLDRQTGREKWTVAPTNLPQESLHGLRFTGSPLVAGDSALIIGHTSKQVGFEDCFVLCFDLAHGRLRWSCPLGSASTMAAMWNGAVNPAMFLPQNTSHLAYANGRVYVQTNRGVVAAIDAYNGTIAWLDIYRRGLQAAANMAMNPMFFQPGQVAQNQTKPWAYNPVIASQGLIFTLPLEGKTLLIYDAESGTEFKQIDLDELSQHLKTDDVVERDDFDTMLAVVGDKLVLAGSKTVVAINWKTYDAASYNEDKMLFWDEPLPKPIRGRGFVTQDAIYIPAEDRLYQLSLKSGTTIKVYPNFDRTWDESEGPGNVLVTADHVIVAGDERVDVYTDLNAAKAKLDRELADAPADPQPRLRYAEVMFAAADYDASLAKLDEAIGRLGGAGSMQAGPVRDRVFNDALTFAQKLSKEDKPDARPRITQLYDRAGQAASAPEQQVHYRIARARFVAPTDPAAAVALYQQILGDAALRAVPLTDDAAKAPASADIVAQKAIDQLARANPGVYEPFEKEAAAAMQEAQAANDPAKLLAVAQVYPNSTVASKAMLAAAQAYEASGDPRAARHVLFDIYSNHRTPGDWPLVLESLARADLQSVRNGGAGAAVKLLNQGVQDAQDPKLHKPLKLPDGTDIAAGTAFSAAVEQVRKFAYQQQDRALPTFRLPVPNFQSKDPRQKFPKPFKPDVLVLNNVDALVPPLRDFARPSRIVTWSSAPLLAVYAPGSDKPVASCNQIPRQPIACAWLDKDLLVWSGGQLALLKGDEAQPAWTVDVARLPVVDVLAAGDEPGAQQSQPVHENVIRNGVFINRGGVVAIRGGLVLPAGAMPAPPPVKPAAAGPEQIDQVEPVGERIMVTTTTGRLLSIEADGGRIAWQTRLTDRPVDRLLANEDFTVLKMEDDFGIRLVVLETFTGHIRGSKEFPLQSGSVPQNVALSPDGTLVYTMPDRVRLKDLYKPWGEREIEKLASQNQGTFYGVTQPDQLVISEGRVLALTDTGGPQGQKFVRIYSLETGEPVTLKYGDGQQLERALAANSTSAEVKLRVVGPRLYVIAPDAALWYNLDKPEDAYRLYGDQQLGDVTAKLSFIGQDYLIFLDDSADADNGKAPAVAPNAPPGLVPGQPAPAPKATISPTYRLYGFGRYHTARGESGRLDYDLKINDPAGITPSWQALDGGICYLTADHKVHVLLGAKQ